MATSKLTKNTTPENFDETIGGIAMPLTEEEVKEATLKDESALLSGLLELADAKNNPDNYANIEIRRQGKLLAEFKIRPLSESEAQLCEKQATKYAKTKPGKAKVALETDVSLFRSLLIYTATIDEDRKKIWDNPTLKQKLNIIQGHDTVDALLLAGEKIRILSIMDEISCFDGDYEETAKN